MRYVERLRMRARCSVGWCLCKGKEDCDGTKKQQTSHHSRRAPASAAAAVRKFEMADDDLSIFFFFFFFSILVCIFFFFSFFFFSLFNLVSISPFLSYLVIFIVSVKLHKFPEKCSVSKGGLLFFS